MAEYKEDGRRFSKRQVINFKDGEELEGERLKQEKGIPEPDFTRSPQDIRGVLEMFRAHAVSVLEAHGLPGAPLVYCCKGGLRWKPAWEVVTTPGWNRPQRQIDFRTLEEHLQDLGYERDSAPDLAARVLGGLYILDQAETHEEVVSAALWLGFDVAFAGVYQSESQEMAGRGSTSKGAGAGWAPLLADHYLAENSKMNCEEVYLRLKKYGRLKVDGWTISAGFDAKKRRAFKAKKAGGKDFRTVTIGSFYNEYWLEAKKKT